jgi:hypothetical protein
MNNEEIDKNMIDDSISSKPTEKLGNDLTPLRQTINELEKLSEDETERGKVISVARDRFLNNRINQATKLEKVRSALIDSIAGDLESNKINPQQKLRFLEVLSKLNEADLNTLIGATRSGAGGVTIFNNNTTNTIKSDIQEQAKAIKIVSKTGEELIKNQAEAQFLIEAVEAVVTGQISMDDIKVVSPIEEK